MDIPDALYWRGRPVEELTREELLEVVNDLARMREQDRSRAEQQRRMSKLFFEAALRR